MIIRGNTVSTNMLRGDYAETDPGKSSFILNKPDAAIAKAQQTANTAAAAAKNAQTTADAALPKTGGVITEALSVPDPTEAAHAVNKGYADTLGVYVTLSAAGWSGDAAPYLQRLAVAGLTEEKKASCTPVWPEALEEKLLLREETAKIHAAVHEGSLLTFECWEDRPTLDIPILVEVYV